MSVFLVLNFHGSYAAVGIGLLVSNSLAAYNRNGCSILDYELREHDVVVLRIMISSYVPSLLRELSLKCFMLCMCCSWIPYFLRMQCVRLWGVEWLK